MDPAIKSDKPINTLSDYLSAFNGSNFTQDYNTLVADYDELKRCTQDSTRNADKVSIRKPVFRFAEPLTGLFLGH